MLRPLPITSGTNLDVDATTAKDGITVAYYNMYLDRADGLRVLPGMTELDDIETGLKCYNHFSKAFGIRFIVSGGRIWQQSAPDASFVYLGDGLTEGVKPAFCEDSASVFVAANSKIFKIASGVMTVLGGNSPTSVTSLLYHGGFILANGPDIPGDTVYSDDKANDYILWEVYNNESKPDRLQTLVLVDSQFIYNLGPESVEVTYFGTNPTNPFEVNRGRLSPFGTIAKYSPVYDDENLYYLANIAQSRKVVRSTQGVPAIISFPLDLNIEQFERVDDAEGYIMAFKGQNFYVLDFPTVNAYVNDQYFESITVAFHIQKQQWLVLASWDADTSLWKSYRGCSFVYIEPWNLRLVSDRGTGKTYTLYDDSTVNYETEGIMRHRWRDDNKKAWSNPRTIALGLAGDYHRPPDQTQCGVYRNRQHEISYTNMTDAGNILRAAILTGNISHGTEVTKRSNFYRYNVKRGTNEFIINSIYEDVTALKQ